MFIFDGVNRKIIIDHTNDSFKQIIMDKTWYLFDAVDLYSAWKLWCVQEDGAKYLPAFSVIGGEDIGGGLKVGAYTFLLSSNGWILSPPEEDDVIIQISGNLYPDIANYPVMEKNSLYSSTLIMRNSNLTQLVTISSGSGLSSEQDTILRGAAKENSLNIVNIGIQKASKLIPHNTNI